MNKEHRIYLDYSATTPVAAEVLEAMLPFFSIDFGNPSSVHFFGQTAEYALERSRQSVAAHLYCNPDEIIFTSGGTESDNLALRGCALARRMETGANHILISGVEHHAVSNTAQHLANYFDFELEILPVDHYGMITPEVLKNYLRSDTAIVSIIYANNEIGTINPISDLGKVCKEMGVPFHTDAVQAATFLSLNVNELNVDMLSLGAHKFYGPKGVGALYVRNGTPLIPIQTGGGQENGKRSGTQNIPYIVGLSEALNYVKNHQAQWSNTITALRDFLINNVINEIPGAQLSGHPTKRLPNHASFVFKGVDSQKLLMMLDLDGFACSSGSACKTGNPAPSDVLLALGFSPSLAMSSLRVTLGKDTTASQLECFIESLTKSIDNCKQ